jgi:hypothetical protein
MNEPEREVSSKALAESLIKARLDLGRGQYPVWHPLSLAQQGSLYLITAVKARKMAPIGR